MIAARLTRWLLDRAHVGADSEVSAIRRVSRFSTSAAAGLLDLFPEADTDGMQVYTVDQNALRELGTRDGATHTLRRFGTLDDAIASGEWDSGPGQHVIKFDFDEWVHFVEGEVNITVQGQTRTLRAGDVAMFRAGLSMTWDVPKYVRKVWVQRYPQPSLLERGVNVLKKLSPL
jgi:uncharacterized cupin superfamily protein